MKLGFFYSCDNSYSLECSGIDDIKYMKVITIEVKKVVHLVIIEIFKDPTCILVENIGFVSRIR